MYKIPLNINDFSFLDRLKICKFFLNSKNRWTQDKYVQKYEEKTREYVDSIFSVYVSSGSSANQLICQYVKDKLIQNKEWNKRKRVIISSVTWQTNVSVWVREGFEPIFLDINLNDFCFDYKNLEEYLEKNNEYVAAVFPTSVLGFTPDIEKLNFLQKKYPLIKFALDCCENFLGEFNDKNVCNFFTSSTSCFFAHQITNGTEGGFIFTNNYDEYRYFLLARAHGLLRNFIPYENKFSTNYLNPQQNPLVDSQFDFQILSSNYRSSDIAAFMGLLNFNKIKNNKNHRIYIYNIFKRFIDREKYYLPNVRNKCLDIPFCLPIICKNENQKKEVIKVLNNLKIEYRSFISGNMLRQLPYQNFGNYKDFTNAEYINNCAIYIGLHPKVKEKQILELTKELNKI